MPAHKVHKHKIRSRIIRIGIIGTGGMAKTHAERLAEIPTCRVTAACDLDEKRASDFAKRYSIPRTFSHAQALIESDEVDAVCVVTPDPFHASLSIAAFKAGKHVLCEKPLATNPKEAQKMALTAASSGRIHMVNFSYRNAPALHYAAKLVASGQLGRIMHIDAHYYQDWLCADHWGNWQKSPAWLWRLSTAHGSLGVLGDVGVHLLDFASYPIGKIKSVSCLLKTFPKAPGERIGPYKLDANDTAIITASFTNGAVGTLQTTRWAAGHHNSITLAAYGEEGAFRIDLDRSHSQIEVCRVRKRKVSEWKTIEAKPTPNIWARFINSIITGHNDQPDFHRGAEIQILLEACFKSHQIGKTTSLDN